MSRFNESDRVSFMAKCGKTDRHYVGYVKQVRKGFFRTSYVICVVKTEEIFVVPETNVFGIVERKDRNSHGEYKE